MTLKAKISNEYHLTAAHHLQEKERRKKNGKIRKDLLKQVAFELGIEGEVEFILVIKKETTRERKAKSS